MVILKQNSAKPGRRKEHRSFNRLKRMETIPRKFSMDHLKLVSGKKAYELWRERNAKTKININAKLLLNQPCILKVKE
jgi:hypothetical protein